MPVYFFRFEDILKDTRKVLHEIHVYFCHQKIYSITTKTFQETTCDYSTNENYKIVRTPKYFFDLSRTSIFYLSMKYTLSSVLRKFDTTVKIRMQVKYR